MIGQLPLYILLLAKGVSGDEIGEMAATMNFEPAGITQNMTLFFMLLAFAGGMLGLWFSVVFIHGKKFRWLITPFERINWRKIFYSFLLWMSLTLLVEFVFYLIHPENYVFHFQPAKFLGLVAVSLVMFPIQTSWEELVFRGYLMQGISLISTFRWIPLLLTSATFGLLHGMNEEVGAFGVVPTMTYYIGTGIFLGIITLMDDSLELALGVHAATNIYSSLFVTFEAASLKTAAVFEMKSVDINEMLIAFFVAAIVYTAIVAKKHGWANWSEKLLGPVSKPQSDLA
jgi:membrane protease YdiL (CAAX protease family)